MILSPHPVPEVKAKRGQRKEERGHISAQSGNKTEHKETAMFPLLYTDGKLVWRFICSPDLREGREGGGAERGKVRVCVCVWGG